MRAPEVNQAVAVPRAVLTIEASAPLTQALEIMRRHAIHHLVVLDDARHAVRGIVSSRELMERGLEASGALNPARRVGDVMVPLARTVAETTSLADAIALMREHGCTGLPVMRDAGLVGIITETDLLRVLAEAFEDRDAVDDAVARGQVLMASPVVQHAMRLVAHAGI